MLGSRGEDLACVGDDVERCRPESAVPHAERIHRDLEESRKFALGEGRVAPNLAKHVHTTTVPCIVRNVKRPPEYQAGDQRLFFALSTSVEIR